jgi:hypothetical protein
MLYYHNIKGALAGTSVTIQMRISLFSNIPFLIFSTHVNSVVAGRGDVGDCTTSVGWQHDAMLDQNVLRDHAVNITTSDVTANLVTEIK